MIGCGVCAPTERYKQEMRKKKDILRIMMFIYSTLFYLCRKQRYENNMNPLFDKPFTFDRVIRIVFGILVISGIIYLIALLRNALLPFLIAWLLAYMMTRDCIGMNFYIC